MDRQTPTQLLTVKQTAERLSMTESALRWLLHDNRGPKSFMLEGRRKFRETDVEEYIAAALEQERVGA